MTTNTKIGLAVGVIALVIVGAAALRTINNQKPYTAGDLQALRAKAKSSKQPKPEKTPQDVCIESGGEWYSASEAFDPYVGKCIYKVQQVQPVQGDDQ